MLQGFARCLLLTGLISAAFLGCGSDPTPENSGPSAGTSSGGSAAGTSTGGSSTSAGTSNAGTATGGAASAGTSTGGTSTAGTGTGGTSTAGTGTGGTGGTGGGNTAGGNSGGSGGSGGAAGGSGGAAAMPTAVATIAGLNGKTVTGTATFTQGATMTTLVLNLTACPNGAHASHLHETKDCGNNGDAAGGHWINGEGLGDYTCTDNKGMLTVMKPTSSWTVGGAATTDVTKYAFMVHETGGTSPGGRIGCGVIDKQ